MMLTFSVIKERPFLTPCAQIQSLQWAEGALLGDTGLQCAWGISLKVSGLACCAPPVMHVLLLSF